VTVVRISAVVIAKCEFEAWFLAAAESLRGRRGLPPNLQPPPDPESVRDAKRWLGERMAGGRVYQPPQDQAALTSVFDVDAARRGAGSFDKCYREVVRLLTSLQVPSG